MAHDVFISYASKDKSVGDAVCAMLEDRRIRCWMAPRDVQPGVPYAECIVDAIQSSRVMVLIFSSSANESPQVMREVERAVSKGVAIIPFRIQDVVPSKSMEYFLSSPHWLDAMHPPLDKHLEYLADTVQLMMQRLTGAKEPMEKPVPPPAAKPAPVPVRAPRQSGAWMVAGVLALLLLAAGGYAIISHLGSKESPATFVAAAPATQPSAMSPPTTRATETPSFQALFNGKDLSGWSVGLGDPDAWKVEKGELVVNGTKNTQGWLLTDKEYSDFAMRLEFQLAAGANSGVTFRALPGEGFKQPKQAPEIQILDDSHPAYANLSQNGKCGSLHALAIDRPAELKPVGEWNTMLVELRGRSLGVSINGKQVLKTDLDNLDRAETTPGLKRSSGRIGLQNWEGTVRFRNIEVKELPSSDASEPSFQPLFNGKDLTGWTSKDGSPAEWKVADGVLEAVPGKGNILTTQHFGPDFELHAEFNVPLHADRKGQPRGNSGIFLVGRYEIQILDSFENPQPAAASCGALYNQLGPSRNVCKPPGEWQTYDITFRAPRLDDNKMVKLPGKLSVVHNGVLVIDNGSFEKPTGYSHLTDIASTGPIMLQENGSAVRFRNLKIKPLPPIAK